MLECEFLTQQIPQQFQTLTINHQHFQSWHDLCNMQIMCPTLGMILAEKDSWEIAYLQALF